MIRFKRKVMIGSLSLSTFLIMSTAYAYSDASLPLQNWYKASFQTGKSEVDSKAMRALNESRQAMQAGVDEMLSSNAARLRQVQGARSQQARNRVEAVSQDYASQIESIAEELTKTEGPAQFDKYVLASNEKLDREVDELAVQVLRELTLTSGK
ncbi:hypothetical protein HZF08_31855 [Paenibacillus sp. CGMCC 1.16610]|uniref:OmpH family outer membrane protein n=1 Tax=Paenibacillus anseongense TaxID=2682845 RepID=A0ABW9UKE7_9BACL|nr:MULTISPECIES: hypothetical protein [Paenibacillus]MBA2942870.1 hypothetical protein [Paenibacillus sp. CGMCC 1.16610]MVQ38355.1 hypothetical protein [Paenibacillus anseongense]